MSTEKKRSMFALIDQNGDNIASLDEIKAALIRACVANPEAEAATMLEGKAGISFEDFSIMDRDEPFYPLALFAFTDTNNDGKITKNDLEVSVTKLDGPHDISELFAKMDTDHDGIVSYPEFKASI